jgi:Tol biopolymer transport system component
MKLCRPTATLVLAVSMAGCAGPSVTVVPSASTPASFAASGGTPLPSRIARSGSDPVSTGEPIALSELSGRIVFDDFEDVFVMDVDGSNVVKVAGDPAGPEFDGAWSPDGEWVVYRDSTRGINENDEIFVARADGSDRRNVTNDPSNDWGPDWSPDGRAIIFNSDRGGGRLRGYLVNPDGSNLRPVDVDGWVEYPSFSPDGTKIAFMGHDGSDYEIYVANLASGAVDQLTDSPDADGWPVWSPDGSAIAFTTVRDDCAFLPVDEDCWRTGEVGEHHDIWLMDADGADPRRVSPEFGHFVAWSPDGEHLLISGEALYVVRPDGTGRLELRADGIGLALGGIPDWTGHPPLARVARSDPGA